MIFSRKFYNGSRDAWVYRLRIDGRKDATTEYIVDIFSRKGATIIIRLVRTLKVVRDRNVDFALCGMIKGEMM